MAKPLKPTAKSEHAGKFRKPPVIDLHAEKTKVPEAEPVAFGINQEMSMIKSGQNDKYTSEQNAGVKTAETDSIVEQNPSKNTTNSKNSEAKMTGGQTSQTSGKNATTDNSSRASQKTSMAKKSGCGGLLVSGFTGGIVALLLGAGLQWSGVIPSFSNQHNAFQSKLASLEGEIESLKQNASDGATIMAQLSSDDRKSLDNIVAAIGKLDSKTKAMEGQLSDVTDNVGTLNNVINSLGGEKANPQAAEALAKQFSDFDNRLQQLSAISGKTAEALDLAHENAKNVDSLSKQIEDMKAEFKTPIQGKEIAAITAANSLKNAIDRGGSYANELAVLEKLSPDIGSLDDLKQYAEKGVPNQAELANEFASVADRIAQTENRPADDAGFGDKLWASAKGLVSSRPIGNVEGDNAGAIAARMEEAIKKGDNDRALSEWQNLPQSAKDVSSDFVAKLKIRRDADAVLSDILGDLTSPTKPQNGN